MSHHNQRKFNKHATTYHSREGINLTDHIKSQFKQINEQSDLYSQELHKSMYRHINQKNDSMDLVGMRTKHSTFTKNSSIIKENEPKSTRKQSNTKLFKYQGESLPLRDTSIHKQGQTLISFGGGFKLINHLSNEELISQSNNETMQHKYKSGEKPPTPPSDSHVNIKSQDVEFNQLHSTLVKDNYRPAPNFRIGVDKIIRSNQSQIATLSREVIGRGVS